MFPFDVGARVAVFVGGVIVQVELIGAVIAHQVEGIFPVELVCDAQVGVIEIRSAVVVSATGGEAVQDPVGVGGAQSGDQGGLIFLEGSFDGQLAGQGADPGDTGPFFVVAIRHGYVEDG